jgi:hypothetical protein
MYVCTYVCMYAVVLWRMATSFDTNLHQSLSSQSPSRWPHPSISLSVPHFLNLFIPSLFFLPVGIQLIFKVVFLHPFFGNVHIKQIVCPNAIKNCVLYSFSLIISFLTFSLLDVLADLHHKSLSKASIIYFFMVVGKCSSYVVYCIY